MFLNIFIWQHFQISNSINSSFPSNALLIVISKNGILVIEVRNISSEWRLADPQIPRFPIHFMDGLVPRSQLINATKNNEWLSFIELFLNLKSYLKLNGWCCQTSSFYTVPVYLVILYFEFVFCPSIIQIIHLIFIKYLTVHFS